MRRWPALLLLLTIAWPHSAWAAPSEREKQAARTLADLGLSAYEAGDFEEAISKFEAAEEIIHAPPHVLFIARAHIELGRLKRARTLLRALVKETLPRSAPPPFRKAQDEAKEVLSDLDARFARLEVSLGRDGAKLEIDGQPAAPDIVLELEPGTHELVAIDPQGERTTERLTLGEGETRVLTLTWPGDGSLAETPDEPDADPSLVGPAVLMGVGGAGALVGAITGGLALREANALSDACPVRNQCPAANQTTEDDARTFGTVSTVGFAVGGAAFGAGLTWLIVALTADGGEDERAVAPTFDGQQLGVRLRF